MDWPLHVSIPPILISLRRAGSFLLRNARRAAVSAAGLVAQDALAELRTEAPENRMGNQRSLAFGHVMSNIAPFLIDGLDYPQAALENLLKWSVAARPTRASAAVDNQLLPVMELTTWLSQRGFEVGTQRCQRG